MRPREYNLVTYAQAANLAAMLEPLREKVVLRIHEPRRRLFGDSRDVENVNLYVWQYSGRHVMNPGSVLPCAGYSMDYSRMDL